MAELEGFARNAIEAGVSKNGTGFAECGTV